MSFSRSLLVLLCLASAPALAKPPKLTVFITVDSMGSDVLLRNRSRFKGGGLSQLLAQGAVFPSGRYDYAETVTGCGHATLATGANPWRHGIVSNRLLNRATGKVEAVLADPNHPVLEAPPGGDDVSPENLLAETLSDRLRLSTQGRGKAVALSGKARAAVALGGRLGQAFWFSEAAGKFVTGTYYAKEFPAWVKAFNEKKVPETYFGKEWTLTAPAKEYLGEDDRPFETDWYGMGRTFPHPLTGGLPGPGPQFFSALISSPLMNDVLVQLAKAAIEGEQLGKDDVPDLLSVSFSALDRTYHLYGPYSWELQDSMIRLDKAVGELLAAADKAAGGRANVLVVLTADHAGAAIPEEWAAAGMPAVRLPFTPLQQGLSKELQARFGVDLLQAMEETNVFLNAKTLADKRIDGVSARRAAAQWLARQPGIALAVAKDDLFGPVDPGGLLRHLRAGYHPDRSGDVVFVVKPFHVLLDETSGTSHGTPWNYDSEVPVVFAGKGVKAGTYYGQVSMVDVAPTVAAVMELGAPAMAEGKIRGEALGGQAK